MVDIGTRLRGTAAVLALALASLTTDTALAGDGTFAVGPPVPAGGFPDAVAVADFDADGRPDLAIPNADDDTVSIRLGRGDGTFEPAVNVITDDVPIDVGIADFNTDGKHDLAILTNTGSVVNIQRTVRRELVPKELVAKGEKVSRR